MFLLPFLHWDFYVQLTVVALHQLDTVDIVGALVHPHHQAHVSPDVKAKEEKEQRPPVTLGGC